MAADASVPTYTFTHMVEEDDNVFTFSKYQRVVYFPDEDGNMKPGEVKSLKDLYRGYAYSYSIDEDGKECGYFFPLRPARLGTESDEEEDQDDDKTAVRHRHVKVKSKHHDSDDDDEDAVIDLDTNNNKSRGRKRKFNKSINKTKTIAKSQAAPSAKRRRLDKQK